MIAYSGADLWRETGSVALFVWFECQKCGEGGSFCSGVVSLRLNRDSRCSGCGVLFSYGGQGVEPKSFAVIRMWY